MTECARYEIALTPVNLADKSFLVLVVVCLTGPYLLGTPPRTRRQWSVVAITIAFLSWLLPLMASLQSR